MTDWRADGATEPTTARPADDALESLPRQINRRADSYAPPTHVQVLHLGDLLPASRPITAGQQNSLSIVPGLPGGPRLWCAGDIRLTQRPCIAIVGTRRASPEGAARARRLARELSAAGVVVVSGLAEGIDTEALTAAIEAGGRVVAVVGTPVDSAYPADNKRLQERIYRDHLLISQFAPGTRVFASNFPARNKLMAAITDGTAVIEASDTSGTKHQMAACVRLGRWLFIAQSLLDDPRLTWPANFAHYPITKILRSTSDILAVLA